MGWQAQRHGADRQKQGKGLCGFQFCFLEGIGSGCGTRSGSAACFSRTGNVTRVRDKRGAIFVRACKPGRQVCSAPETAELRTGCMAGDGKQAVETSGSKIAVTVFMPYCLPMGGRYARHRNRPGIIPTLQQEAHMLLTGEEPFFIVMNTGSGKGDAQEKADAIRAVMNEAGRRYEITQVKGGD